MRFVIDHPALNRSRRQKIALQIPVTAELAAACGATCRGQAQRLLRITGCHRCQQAGLGTVRLQIIPTAKFPTAELFLCYNLKFI
jgi:hypothetical protein